MTISVVDASSTASFGTSASISAPAGGDWDFVFASQRTENAFAQPDPEPVVTSAATLLHFMDGTARTGEIRSYASNKVSPITATYASGIDSDRNSLCAVSISGARFPDPSEVTASTSTQNTLNNLTFTISPPTGTVEGDLLLVAFAAGRYGGTGEITLSIDAGLTTAINLSVGSSRTRAALCWRIATADDEAGTTSYTISTINSAGAGAANQAGQMVMLGKIRPLVAGPVIGYIGPQ